MKYFDYQNNRLIFEEQAANANYWDNLWNDDNLKETVKKGKRDWLVYRTTKKFIAPGKTKKILEGGCGKGQYVFSLDNAGYDAYGVDYAENTVKKINEIFPSLKITMGNVEQLDFPDEYFDGYWSLGVIEHFYGGYDKAAKEMSRVIKKGGYLFITFPYLSPLRKIKIRMEKYKKFEEGKFNRDNFYQFALEDKKVQHDLEKLGFSLKAKKPLDGIKGLKDEIELLKPFLQKIYSSSNVYLRILRILISNIFSHFSGHTVLLIFKKND